MRYSAKEGTKNILAQSISPHTGNKEFRCYEAKIQESEKATVAGRGHFWLEHIEDCGGCL